jgi:hypothetical protein
MLVLGTFSLLIMVILRMISINLLILDFLEGMSAGISIIMNICFLIQFGKEQKIKNNLLSD